MMNKSNYKHLFFDLDRTLWDFDQSALQTFALLYERHGLKARGIPDLKTLFDTYNKHNDVLWDAYRNGDLKKEILRDLRFSNTLESFGIEDQALTVTLSEEYLHYAPRTVHLFPDAVEVVKQLHPHFELHLITNGFVEVQHIKIQSAGLEPFFDKVITSEAAGVKKPDPKIFEYALQQTGADKKESLMIGDDLEVDILGAQSFGMDQLYFNPEALPHNEKPTYEIRQLKEIVKLLL
ncbi:MAG: YjjG family noncanonical pyrimidine nucleotidase [Bacteroidetes bacterium]|nr:YjjG family noncanonical pyrimidine nucleotidase [Bacteroidota bacterium]MBU1578364.1 YjjG family noncanonical pyrimidine nucleotidase [Bacteroidota bacterium]MBU2559001.1 YjjG family noncanonical pyrimidine nucleotidase [Bacteroidota bacterium]